MSAPGLVREKNSEYYKKSGKPKHRKIAKRYVEHATDAKKIRDSDTYAKRKSAAIKGQLPPLTTKARKIKNRKLDRKAQWGRD